MPAERWPLLCSAVSSSTSGSTSTISAAHLEIAAARPPFDANLQRILDTSSLGEFCSAGEPNPVRGSFPPFYPAQRRLPARSLRGDPPGGSAGPLPIAPAPNVWGAASAHRLPTAGFLPVVPEALAAVTGGSSPVHGLVSLPERLHGLFTSTDFLPSAQLPPSAHDAASRAAAHRPLPASLMLPPPEPRAAGTAGKSAAASATARWESDSAATLAAPLTTSTSAALEAGFATFAGSDRHVDDGASRWRRRLELRCEPVAAGGGGAPHAAEAGATWAFPSAEQLVAAADEAAGGGAGVAANESKGIPVTVTEGLPRALELARRGMDNAEGDGGLEGVGGGGGIEGVVETWGTWDTACGAMGMDAGLRSAGTGLGAADMSADMGMGAGAGADMVMGTGMGMDIEAAVEMELRCAEELLRRTAMVAEAEAPAIAPEGEADAPAMAPREAEVTAMAGEVEARTDSTQDSGMADPPSHPLALAAAQAPPVSGGDAPSPGAAPEIARLSRRNTWSAAPFPSSADAALMQAMELDRLEHDAAMARLTAMAASHSANPALPPAPPLASTLLSPTAPRTRLSAAPTSAVRAADAIMTAAPAAAMPAAMADGAMDAPFLPALDFPSRPKRAKPLHPPVLPADSAPPASPAAVSLAEAFRMEALRAGWGEKDGEGEGEMRDGEMQESGGQGVETWQGGEGGEPAGGESTACGASSCHTSKQGGVCEGDGEAVDTELPGSLEGQADGDGGAEERGREAVMEGPSSSGAAGLWNPARAAGGNTASGGGGKPALVTAAAGAACAGRGGGAIFDPWAPTRTTTLTVAHLPGIAPAVQELLARRFATNQERSAPPAVAPEVQQLFARRHTVSGTPSVRDLSLQPSLPGPLHPLPFTLPTIHSLEDPLPLVPGSLASLTTTAPAAAAAAAAAAPSARTLFPSVHPFSSTTLGGHHVPSLPTTVPAPFPSPATSSPAIPFRFLTPPLTPSSPPLTVTPRGAISADQENAREALALPDGVGPPLPRGSEMLAGRIPRVHGCNECLPLLVPSYFKRRAAVKKHTPNKST
ncbi:unnamed protein product [Closterium sp. NIES-65]|nr:unnamed protein product [Closterium sp. NIES-65]